MKKTFLIALWTLLFSLPAFSQGLTFCERFDAQGQAINTNTQFTVAKNGGPVTFSFTLPVTAKFNSINFDVYRIVNGKEVYQSTVKQPVTANQKTVVKPVTFYDEGRYRVYVFDEADKQLAKAELSIKKAN